MKYFFTLVTGFLSVMAAIAQTPRKVEADKIVGIVGDKIILQSDLLNEMADRQRRGEPATDDHGCSILDQLLTMKALVLQAEKDSIEIKNDELEAALDNRIRGFIRQYGSEKELCEIAGRSIYQLKEYFRQPIKERMLIERLSQQIAGNVTITPQEVKKYFAAKNADSLPFYESEVEIGEIVVYPRASHEMEKLTIDELNDFKKQVESGKQKIDILARLYSEDKTTKDLGGELRLNRTDKTWDQDFIDRSFIGQVFRLKPGQVSSVFRSKSGYHMVQLVARNGDDATIRHILRIPKFTDQEIDQGINKLDTVRARMIAGTLPFGEAVAKYSESDSRHAGGMLVNYYGNTLIPFDGLDKELVLFLDKSKLKPGQYSKPTAFVDEHGKQGVRIVYYKTRTTPHRQNLKDDYDRITEEALAIKKEQAMETWLAARIPRYYVMIDPAYTTCSGLQHWLKKAAD